MKRICVVTSTRADYGLLNPLIEKINLDGELELQLVVTGMHLSPEFGFTYKQIENDGYRIKDRIEILMSSDTSVGISKSMGLAMISFGELYERIKPDALIVLGDRYEIFSAAVAATVAKIPIFHIQGGETTQGAFDEAFRHSITKMSYLHFTSTESYRKRVIQLGENPNRVFNVGALGVENIKKMNLLSKEELESQINFKLDKKNVLVTFHPVTLENNTSREQFENLLDALNDIEGIKIIFTKTNSDIYGRIINDMIDEYVRKNKNRAIAFTSLGQLRYLSMMKYSDAVIGNSSSGIIEAPSFNIPTVNIGDRQKRRIQADSIINCKPKKHEIFNSIKKAMSYEFKNSILGCTNPYDNGNTSEKIIEEIKNVFKNNIDIKKEFFDLDMNKFCSH